MRHALLAATLLAATLVACNREAPAPATQPGTEAAVSTDAAAPAIGEVPAQPEAADRTGIWAEPAGVCSRGDKDGVLIGWNVRGTGVDKVQVDVATSEGREKSFAKGGASGSKQTGRWVRPGHVFKLRNQATGEELGVVTVSETPC